MILYFFLSFFFVLEIKKNEKQFMFKIQWYRDEENEYRKTGQILK